MSAGVHSDRVSLGDPVATSKAEPGKGAVLSSGSSYNSIPPVVSRGVAGGNVQNVRWRPSVFDFKSERGGGSICPTCKGVGRIPKGQEDELVALIPYNDKRLKPRRTCLYVSLMALVLIVMGGVLTAFLYPRSIVINVSSLNSSPLPNITSWYLEEEAFSDDNMSVLLGVKATILVKNSNFFPVTVSVVNVTLMYSESQVGFESYPTFTVTSRSTKNVNVTIKATFVKPQSRKVHFICYEAEGWQAIIYLTSSVVAQYSYLSQSSSAVGELGDHVDCSNARTIVSAPTLRPP